MVQDLAVVVTVLLGISLLPALLLWVFLRLISSDGSTFSEFGEGSTAEFESTVGLQSESEANGAATSPPNQSAVSDDVESIDCSDCGAENDARFDRCWNCLDAL